MKLLRTRFLQNTSGGLPLKNTLKRLLITLKFLRSELLIALRNELHSGLKFLPLAFNFFLGSQFFPLCSMYLSKQAQSQTQFSLNIVFSSLLFSDFDKT